MKKEHPQKAKSKQWIVNSLLELMAEKDYQSITIKELTQKADLDRKTFYRHFSTKEEVLYIPLNEICQCYLKSLRELTVLSSYTVTEAFFILCIEHMTFFDLLLNNNLYSLLLDLFEQYLSELNEIFADTTIYRYKNTYELTYQAGGFWNITKQWISAGAKESPQKMALFISEIMPPATE